MTKGDAGEMGEMRASPLDDVTARVPSASRLPLPKSNQITSNAAISKTSASPLSWEHSCGQQSNQTYQTNISQAKWTNRQMPQRCEIRDLRAESVPAGLLSRSRNVCFAFVRDAFILLLINLILLRGHSSANVQGFVAPKCHRYSHGLWLWLLPP